MPQGIVASVEDGFATIDFVDPALRGPGLQKLLDIGGPESIETITRVGPRRKYRVAEGNAREAGLVDDAAPQARGLNTDGTPNDNDATGGTGTTQSGVVDVAAGDTGAATALVNADPNTGSDIAGADGPASTGTVDWHTPVDQFTSANAYVGEVPNSAVLHNRDQVFTGTGTVTQDGDREHPETHADLITRIKDNSDSFQRTEGTREPLVPAAVVSNALRSQTGALASDPGGDAPQGGAPDPLALQKPRKAPKKAPAHLSAPNPKADAAKLVTAPSAVSTEPPAASTEAPTATPSTPVADARPEGLPEGEPDEDWKRTDLNAYAIWKGVENPDALANKAEVLAAISAKG